MGRISAFLGIILYMYPEKGGKHNKPHLHAFYGDEECEISIPDGEVLAGSLPARSYEMSRHSLTCAKQN